MYGSLGRDWVDTAMAIGVVALLVMLVGWGISEMDGRTRAGQVNQQLKPTAKVGESTSEVGEEVYGPLDAIVIEQQLAPGEVAVYECIQDGHKTISDRHCGPGAVGRIIDTRSLNTFSQVPITPVDMSRHRQPQSIGAGPRVPARQTAQTTKVSRCKSIQNEIDSINAHMRQPYRKEEGEWLRRRWHSAKELYYDEGCGKLNLPMP